MSKLEELIQQYCPDGVEWKTLGDATIMKRGTSATKGIMQEGNIPVISGGRQPAFYCNVSNRIGEVITIAGSGAGAGYVQYWNEPIFVCDAFSIQGDETLKTKYIYYVLTSIQEKIYSTKKGGGVPHVHISSIDKFEIPIPPLPVQEEIVRILDKFTELQAELQAELQKRKQQYNYYLDNLLNFNRGGYQAEVRWMKMSEVCLKISSGGTPSRKNGYYFKGSIPWLRTQEVDWNNIYDTEIKITEEAFKNSSAKLIPENCVIIAMYGATAGKAGINKIPLTTNQACCNLQINPQTVLYKYAYYWVCKNYEKIKSLGQGSQNNINAQIVKDYPIPVPSLSDQQKIVSILDRFDRLTNDLSSGLPAEMEKRRQQYEFYRDKLLTFKMK